MVAVSDTDDPRWTRVCRVDDLDPARPLGRVVGDGTNDRDRVCVVAHSERFVAMLDRCPHRDIALSGGIVRDGELVCPGHFWRFDLATGRRVDDAKTTLNTYITRVVDDWIEALIPASAPKRSMRDWLLAEAAASGDADA